MDSEIGEAEAFISRNIDKMQMDFSQNLVGQASDQIL